MGKGQTVFQRGHPNVQQRREKLVTQYLHQGNVNHNHINDYLTPIVITYQKSKCF